MKTVEELGQALVGLGFTPGKITATPGSDAYIYRTPRVHLAAPQTALARAFARRPRAMAHVQFAAPEPAAPDPARRIGPDEQAAIWAVVRGRFPVKSEATAVLARVLGKHGCQRTAQVLDKQLEAVLETARTI